MVDLPIFRFWLNDDADTGDISEGDSDVPGRSGGLLGKANYKNNKVDGRSDLEDFFPVWLNLGRTLAAFPPSGVVQYRLSQADGAVKAVYTDLRRNNAGAYLVSEGDSYGSLFSKYAHEANTFTISPGGIPLSPEFLNRIVSDGEKGVLLMEGAKATTEPLVLEVFEQGISRFRAELPLSIDGVEKMYRWINLRPGGGPPTSTNEPPNYPDAFSNGTNVFFLHGFNVTADESRGWNAEMFKRLYQSGSRAKFWGMTWRGDQGAGWEYQINVANAFAIASNFNVQVSGVSGDKIVLAHSLGNMVVSAAIQDYGLNVDKYFMLNAAVAMECYRPASFSDATNNNYLLHEDWTGYSNKTWCSKWFELFSSPDDREKLAWKDRFPSVVSVAYNFYSSGDEIFETYTNGTPSPFSGGVIPWHVERYAWQKQEMFKGRTILGLPVLGGTDWAGWGFGGGYSMATANAATPDNLRTNAAFRHEPAGMFSSNIAVQVRNDIIARGVPALSYAAGENAINLIGFYNYNMDEAVHKPNGWGRSGGTYGSRWLHSDLKNMAYLYTYELFNELVSQGSLQ